MKIGSAERYNRQKNAKFGGSTGSLNLMMDIKVEKFSRCGFIDEEVFVELI